MSLRGGAGGDAARSAAVRALKASVAALVAIGPDDTVMVSELRCTEPGCPPLETVVAVLRSGEAPKQYKIHKAVLEVSDDDVRAALAVGAAHVHGASGRVAAPARGAPAPRPHEGAVHEAGASSPVSAGPSRAGVTPSTSASRPRLEHALRDGVLVGVPGRTRAPCRVPCTRPLDPALDAQLRTWLRARSDIPREAPIRLGEWISTDVRSLPHAVWIVVGDGASARDAVLPCASAALVAADIAALDFRARG